MFSVLVSCQTSDVIMGGSVIGVHVSFVSIHGNICKNVSNVK